MVKGHIATFFQLVFTQDKAKQPLRGNCIKVEEEGKNERHTEKLNRKSPNITCAY